ncbi:hypothetical protein GGI35DRAFT_158682 [Trichoderma velutinum]
MCAGPMPTPAPTPTPTPMPLRDAASVEAAVGVEGFAVIEDRVLSVLALVPELMRKAASFSAIVTQALAESSRPLPCVRNRCWSRRGAFTSFLTGRMRCWRGCDCVVLNVGRRAKIFASTSVCV